MSQAQTNIGPVKASHKTTPQPTQGRTAQSAERKARPRTPEHRLKQSIAQLAYVANDPRWPEHQRKLVAFGEARRMTLLENEVAAIVAMRKDGQNWEDVSKKIGVSRDVIKRELALLGIRAELDELGRHARQVKLFDNKVPAMFDKKVPVIMEMRRKGRTFEYIGAELGICRKVITRELAALGHSTERVKADRRARRGKGFWRSFDLA